MAKIAFLFPGQGAQTVGMGQALADSLPSARHYFDLASQILGYDLLAVCSRGPVEKLNSTAVSQPAIFVCSLAALESLKQTQPDAVGQCASCAGLSLGEYTALVFAGAIGFENGLQLVRKRGEAMQAAADATKSAMVAVVGMEQAGVEALCAQAKGDDTLQIANLLCPGNIVLSGNAAACDRVEKLAETQGARTIRLAVAGAFHTPLMKPADEKLACALAGVTIAPPRIPVWSNVDARPHTDPEEIRTLLVRQVLEPVLWEQLIRNLMADGTDRFYEIGPGRVLAGLLKRIHRKVDCQNTSA